MSVRMRHTREHTKNRRSHHALSNPAISLDDKKQPHLRHRVSPINGTYKGKQIIEPKMKKAQKNEANEEKASE